MDTAPARAPRPLDHLVLAVPDLAAATGRFEVATPVEAAARYGSTVAPGRFAGFGVAVASLDAAAAILDRAGVPHARVGGAVVVPPLAAFGAALAFVPDACESDV